MISTTLQTDFRNERKQQERRDIAKQSNPQSINEVYKHIMEFAFHSRSECEWKKFKSLRTDRILDSNKKLGRRELLKAFGNKESTNDKKKKKKEYKSLLPILKELT